LTGVVARCEADDRLRARHVLSDEDKKNLFMRWDIQQARLNGNEERVRGLVEQVMDEGSAFTDETRDYLRLHGFAPKRITNEPKPRHPNHRIVELDWLTRPPTHAKAA
jgi:hypothetical protein